MIYEAIFRSMVKIAYDTGEAQAFQMPQTVRIRPKKPARRNVVRTLFPDLAH